jgi:signal transduction histidine kinase/ActR/RegA family two-component response regulator
VVTVVILALLLSLFLSRSIGSVGTQLVRLCDAVTRGDLSRRVDEADVSVDFRRVVHRINDLVDALVERLDSIPVPVLLLEPDRRIRFANSAACELKGRDRAQLIGERCRDAFALGRSCDERCLVAEAIERRAIVSGEVAGSAGQAYLVTASPLLDSDGKVVGGFEVVVDRSEARRADQERRALEDRVARMQRLEAVGTLAGGIAHDFNNILTYMFAYTDIVQGLLPEGSPAAPHVDALVAAIQRAADLVAQILAFSRQARLDPHPLDLAPLVTEAMKLVKASLSPAIALHVEVPDRRFTVRADPTQMHQVVLNLLTNARQAMAGAGGRLEVRLDDVVLESPDARATASLPAGAYRVLEVKDTGCGMDARTLERVFEPFFTTKPVGQGTGMGLALVHGIVTSAGGAVLIESTPGQGTTVRVLLPRSEEEPAGNTRNTADADGRGRRVLFVDDERRVCETSQQLLESLGYRVQALSSGADAVAELEAHGDQYDVVVTDLRMPEVGGLQVTEAARARPERLPIVLTTAYADSITPEQARAAGIAEVLLKPFRKSDLARVLHGLLGGSHD